MAMVAAAPLTLMTLVEPAEAVFPVADGKIVFSSNQDTGTNPTGDLEIFTMKPDGAGVTQLTFNMAGDVELAYSSNGNKIAFGSDRTGDFEVFKMKANGANQTIRTNNDERDFAPDWAPLKALTIAGRRKRP